MNIVKNNKGITSVDFIFAMVLIMGFSSILFALSLTLSMFEITQYITFSSARSYFAAHVDKKNQIDLGQQKYQQLVSSETFKPLFSGGWFVLSPEAFLGSHTEGSNEIGQSNIGPFLASAPDMFIGVSTNLVAPILDFNVPFFGSTSPSGDGQGLDFETSLGSFIGREPASNECKSFIDQRWEQIKNLDGQYGKAGASLQVSIADNGC